MPVLDLLNWPVTEGFETEDDEGDDPRTVAELRAELADAQRELRRVRARLDHVEEENERLSRQVERMTRTRESGEIALPLATPKRAE